MSAIFLSHSSFDNRLVQELERELREAGFASLFLDFDPQIGIPAGADWEQTLYRKLNSARAVVALLTDHSLGSKWCFTEVALARALGKLVFALKADPWSATAKVPPILAVDQVIDLRGSLADGVSRLLRGLDEKGLSPGHGWNRNRSPYPGLAAFDELDSGVFFGRERETQLAVELATATARNGAARLVIVLGASGSGKSSLMRAGVLPRLRKDASSWIVLPPFRPGAEPMEELAAVLGAPTDDLPAAARHIRRSRKQSNATVALTIDQFEELLSRPTGAAFLALLRSALDTEDDNPLLVLATLRSDWLPVLQRDPHLLDLDFRTLLVGPMPRERLREVIEEPARLAETTIDPALVDALLADTRTSDALPLLAFTLREMWDKQALTLAGYQELGRLGGSIAKAAEALLPQQLTTAQEERLRASFLKLVRLSDDGIYTKQPAPLTDLPARAFIDRFINRRLLVSSSERGAAMVEVAHEALFTEWGRLRDWLDASREALRLAQQLRQSAANWAANNEDPSYLYRGRRLSQTLAAQLPFTSEEERFLRTSEKVERDEASSSFEARARSLVLEARKISELKPALALNLAVEAVRLAPAGLPELRRLLTETGGSVEKRIDEEVKHIELSGKDDHSIRAVPSGPGSVSAVTIGWKAHVDDEGVITLSTAAWASNRTFRLAAHKGRVKVLAFSPDRHWLASGGEDSIILLWDLQAVDPSASALRLADHQRDVNALAFSEDSLVLVSGGRDAIVRLWTLDPNDPSAVKLEYREGSEFIILKVAYNRKRNRLLASTWGPYALYWNAGQPPIKLLGHSSSVDSLAVDEDWDLAVTASSRDNFALLWNLDRVGEGQLPVKLRGEESWITCAAMWRNEVYLGSRQGSLRVYHQPTAQPSRFIPAQVNLNRVVFAANRLLATGETAAIGRPIDPRGKLVNFKTGEVDAIHDFEDAPVVLAAMSSAGRWLATGARDGRISRRSGDKPPEIFRLGAGCGISALALMDDGRLIAGSPDGALSTAAGDIRSPHTSQVVHLCLGVSDRFLASGCVDGKVALWQVLADRIELLTFRELTPPIRWLGFLGSVCLAIAETGQLLTLVVSQPDPKSVFPVSLLTPVEGACARRGRLAVWNHGQLILLFLDEETGAVSVSRSHNLHIGAADLGFDGQLLATTTEDGQACLWQIHSDGSLEDAGTLPGHKSLPQWIEFSEDGMLFTGDSHGFRVWDTDTQRLTELAGSVAGRNLTPEEWAHYFPSQLYRKTFDIK